MAGIYNNRRYITFNVSEADEIDFTQVEETSRLTLRKSINGELAIVKYELPPPSSVINLTTKSQEYTHSEIKVLLNTSAWTDGLPY
jgi:hypothetical protein